MTTIPLATTGPEKPSFGDPCNGCGYCCAAEVCKLGQSLYGPETPAPCPGMEFHDGRFWCAGVRMADEMGLGPMLRLQMGIGIGCDSDDP